MDSLLEKMTQIIEPLAAEAGVELLLIEQVSERGMPILRIYLDKESAAISVEDCEKVSRGLDSALESENFGLTHFQLEVSSPGVNRPLVKPAHFQKQLGKVIQVVTHSEWGERRNFKGELREVHEKGEEPAIEMFVDEKCFTIPLSQVKRANLDFFASEASSRKARQARKKKKIEPS